MKSDFPLFKNNPGLIYFDSAGTSQKPQVVIDAEADFYAHYNAPVHRGMYLLAERATVMYEKAREKIAHFINADSSEIVFTSGATDGINRIAQTWAFDYLQEGDQIVLSMLEHHANIVPWQFLAQQKKIKLQFIPIKANGDLDYDSLDSVITKNTKLIVFADVSNAIGTRVDVARLVQKARAVSAFVLIDASQSVGHQKVDVKEYDCDFLVFSGHKMLGPTGVGVLYIKKTLQPYVRPHNLGGGMVEWVSMQSFQLLSSPYCYQAGTAPIAQVIALAAAVDYLTTSGLQKIAEHGAALCAQLINGLQKNPYVKILGPVEQLSTFGHIVSFVHTKHHHHDLGYYLNQANICVRTGHYCAQPLAQALAIDGSVRVSFYVYNEGSEVETFLNVLNKFS